MGNISNFNSSCQIFNVDDYYIISEDNGLVLTEEEMVLSLKSKNNTSNQLWTIKKIIQSFDG